MRPTRARGFARGFSIQTVSPLPIGWAEHVIAEGHRGAALREYMRDYNHWATIGVLNELLPQAENRVTLADETDGTGCRSRTSPTRRCENDRRNMEYSKGDRRRSSRPPARRTSLTIDRYAHLIGGARMGIEPRDSVIDSDHRVWGVPNLFVADGSVCPTQGSANPALTIMALASRLAERLSGEGEDGLAVPGWAPWLCALVAGASGGPVRPPTTTGVRVSKGITPRSSS